MKADMTAAKSKTTKPATLAKPKNAVRTWIDENTGREVRLLTHNQGAANLNYFRFPRHLPNGEMLARVNNNYTLLNPDTGEFRPMRDFRGGYLKFRVTDGRLWTYEPKTREIFEYDLPAGIDAPPRVVGRVPETVRGSLSDITCDGRTVILLDLHQYQNEAHPAPTKLDAKMFWHYIARPRHGRMLAYDLQTGRETELYKAEDHCPFHVDTHPTDPTCVRFAIDLFEAYNQRVWAVKTDGSDLRKIRPQHSGELVTHEFYYAEGGKPGSHIGYTYQDRRNDPTARDLPWAEYSKSKTQLGISDLSGKEIYLSDPVNHYHTHLYSSFNGKLLSGSGTDGHSFVYAARFSLKNTKVDYIPLATIHTAYVPFQGQHVNCDISADGKWLIYSDEVDGKHELCAVAVDI